MQGCCPYTRFVVPPKTTHWVALLQRGKCTFKEKILRAATFNASAVLIYNNSSKEDTVTMAHEGQHRCPVLFRASRTCADTADLRRETSSPLGAGCRSTGDTVAVMITESFGKDILALVERNETVLVSVAVGQRGAAKNMNRGSLVFVSISFIVLMIISSAWLIFYFIQKIRDSSARDRSQRQLGAAAKKAISKLTTRTVKRGDKVSPGLLLSSPVPPSLLHRVHMASLSPSVTDYLRWCLSEDVLTPPHTVGDKYPSKAFTQETDPDFNHCAVCIESYQLNDVVRILPCKHVFHKMCVDPWLNEHCTCPMCKLNILKALGITPNLPCVDNVAFDMDHLSRGQASSQRAALVDLSSEMNVSLEPLRHSGSAQLPTDTELPPRAGEINIAVTSGHFFSRNTGPPRSAVCEMELPDIQASLNISLSESPSRESAEVQPHPAQPPSGGELSTPVRLEGPRSHRPGSGPAVMLKCGACWAFSVVGAVEAVRVKEGGTLQKLSVQQVIDCAYQNQGCNGGSTVTTLDWLKKTKEKLVNETEYPYNAETGVCRLFPQTHGGVVVRDYSAFDFSEQETAMQEWLVDQGPLVVTVDATSWQDYFGGVIQHHCSSRHANHAVLITGFDTTGEVPFWIVRNSWGRSWGDEGYVYIKMGDNMCVYTSTSVVPASSV
ncbi:hypothetical protein P4O66_003768 [Electrophorus voltai]|uniref:RING-type domain-containing protein n=1 Tax=Electrophorus voltai TaxID=2609070 RepID=A0AAD8ZSG6_9TELE|nr:hypothetical protein P4O66_003768 [Electrophorus voltai]